MILKRHESKSKQQSTDAASMLPVYRTIMDVKTEKSYEYDLSNLR